MRRAALFLLVAAAACSEAGVTGGDEPDARTGGPPDATAAVVQLPHAG